MKHLREQAHKEHADKTRRMAGGHSDAAADKALVHKMVKPSALKPHKSMGGGMAPNKETMKNPQAMMNPLRKSGGKAGGKSHKSSGNKVNVIVAPRAQDRPVPVPVAPRAGAGPVGVRPSLPAPAGLGAMQTPLKKGGRACHADGGRVGKHHFDAGAGSGEGRLEKIGRKP